MLQKKLNNINTYLFYQVLRFISLFLINILMAKSSLPLANLGKFETFTFYASLFSFFWITGISQGFLISNKPSNNSGTIDSKTGFNAFLLMQALSSIIAAIILFNLLTFDFPIFPGLPFNFQVLLSVYIIVYPSGFLTEYVLLSNQKYTCLSVYGIISFFGTVLLVPIPSLLGFPVEFSVFGLIAAAVFKFIYLLVVLKQFSDIKLSTPGIVEIIRISTPLIGSAFIAGSSSYIDSFLVSQQFDSETFAIFKFGAREFPLFILIASSFNTSMLPLIARKEQMADILAMIKLKSRQYIQYFFPMAILMLLCSQYIFEFVFSKDFYKSYQVFDIYLLIITCRFVFPSTILMGLKQNRLILKISVIELLINVVASLLFMKLFGYLGVVYGTVVAYFFEKILSVVYVYKRFHIPFTNYTPVYQLGLYSAAIISIFILKLYWFGS